MSKNNAQNEDVREHGSDAVYFYSFLYINLFRITVRTYTWHRDSHGLFDYESWNITQNYLKCNYSGTSYFSKNSFIVILYRYDNDIIFEEKRIGDKMPVDPAAIILEKDSKTIFKLIF
jgi:hypothetical protein